MKRDSIDPMLMSITTPGLPPFYGDYGLWETALALPACAELRRGLAERPVFAAGVLEPDVCEPDEVPVCLKAADKWPSEMQFLNCRWLEEMDEAFAAAIMAAIVAHVPSLRAAYDFLDPAERERLLPADADATTLRLHIRLRSVTIQPVHSGTPYLGVDFDCAWDEEHGLGLVLYGTEVLEVGGGEVAGSEGAAKAHHAALLGRLQAGTIAPQAG